MPTSLNKRWSQGSQKISGFRSSKILIRLIQLQGLPDKSAQNTQSKAPRSKTTEDLLTLFTTNFKFLTPIK